MKVKVIQTDIKMYNVVVSIIRLILKQIGQYMSKYKPMLKCVCVCVCFIF